MQTSLGSPHGSCTTSTPIESGGHSLSSFLHLYFHILHESIIYPFLLSFFFTLKVVCSKRLLPCYYEVYTYTHSHLG